MTMIRMVGLNNSRNQKLIGLGIVLILLQAIFSQRLAVMNGAWVEPPSVSEKWDPEVFKMVSFGNLAVGIDWLILKCLTDNSMDHVAPKTHLSLYYTLDLLSELDPLYFDVYEFAGNLLTVIQGDGVGAKDILLKGNAFAKEEMPHYKEAFIGEYWNNPWRIPLLLAYTYLFQLDDMARAAEAFQEVTSYPGAPSYASTLAHRLRRPGGEYEVGLKLLGFLVETTKDSRVRLRLEKKRKDLFVIQYLYELNQSFLNFLKLQANYNRSGSVTFKQMSSYFKEFMRRNQISHADPWGGSILIDSQGRIVSSTPHDAVFGLR